GHQIPAWYTPSGDIFIGESLEEAIDFEIGRLQQEIERLKAGAAIDKARVAAYEDKIRKLEFHKQHPKTLKRDEDVLDTWFSAALWPFSTMGWPKT
ncbi:valyl-tRNA synthetase, partial [mine drainage metagenome]